MMNFNAILGLFYIISVRCWFVSCDEWGYGDTNGPEKWEKMHNPICGDNSQSPINIVQETVVVNSSLGQFSKSLFSTPPTAMTIKNNGHALQVDMTGAWTINNPSLLPGAFKAIQFHFHWGSNATSGGSEHTLNGQTTFGELHIVHYNTKYDSVGEAVDKSDGLAVLGFFIKADYPQDNLEFERILKPVRDGLVTYPSNNSAITPTFAVETLLPDNMSVYYRYGGSLTTPPCYESVVWTLFPDPIQISLQQANVLSSMIYKTQLNTVSARVMSHNNRPTQSLNGRTVYKPAGCGDGAAATTRLSLQLFSLCAIVLSLVSLV